MRKLICLIFIISYITTINAQYDIEDIISNQVLQDKRTEFNKYLNEYIVKNTFAQPLNPTTEEKYESACWAITQYELKNEEVKIGLDKMFDWYYILQYPTRRALLETIYGLYPVEYRSKIQELIVKEKQPKVFAMMAAYLYRCDNSQASVTGLLNNLKNNFRAPNDTLPLLAELKKYLTQHNNDVDKKLPSLNELFVYNESRAQKVIYSFQRWNRDYPGLAVVQYASGRFARDSTTGKLLVFRQLARSASDLPYFITNGSTPQGAYSIQGIGQSVNNLIGPTPNIQSILPFEKTGNFWNTPYDSMQSIFNNYLNLFPPSWQNYEPVTEAFYAGKVGRSAIIAHGTTINPEYFKDKPYYPLTPTLGCLCAKEIWNEFNGRLQESDQLIMINTFLETPVDRGYLFVINLDNKHEAVSIEEIEAIVNKYEKAKP